MTGTNRGPHDRVTLRTGADRAAFGAAVDYARQHDLSRPVEAAYLEALEDARREILHRFARGVLRGDPDGVRAARFVDLESAAPREHLVSTPRDPLEGATLRAIVEDVRGAVPETCRKLSIVPCLASGSALVVPIAARHGYDRFRLTGPVLRWSEDESTELAHPVDLVPILECEGAFSDPEQAERIRGEVAESVANSRSRGWRGPFTGDGSTTTVAARANRPSRPSRTAFRRPTTPPRSSGSSPTAIRSIRAARSDAE